ncbi:MAG: aldolase [Methanosarcinales archaeon]|nr:aldolase [Methanosarcinales archaeon]
MTLEYNINKFKLDIATFGKRIIDEKLVDSNFGNISVKIGNDMLITKSGCCLDNITNDDVVCIGLNSKFISESNASSETPAHRMIYKNTSACAIIHAHSPYSVIQSVQSNLDVIFPIDKYGVDTLNRIPIIKGDYGTEELAKNAAYALIEHKGIIVYNHGTFAIGKTLDEAYNITKQIEKSCEIILKTGKYKQS